MYTTGESCEAAVAIGLAASIAVTTTAGRIPSHFP
jgi:hypothetical protein